MSTRFDELIRISEVDDGAFFVNDLFRRKFGSDAPSSPHHVAAYLALTPDSFKLVGYAHFMPFGDIMLVGGVCTNGRAFETLDEAQRNVVREAGGVYFQVLRYAFARFADDCEAYFGYCGDARAEQVNLSAGFRHTGHPHLLVNFHKPQHEVMQRALIAKAAAIGPF